MKALSIESIDKARSFATHVGVPNPRCPLISRLAEVIEANADNEYTLQEAEAFRRLRECGAGKCALGQCLEENTDTARYVVFIT